MVGLKTIFNVTDNSGAVIVQCIKILNSHNQSATIGSFVVVAVNKVKIRKKMKVKNHNVYFGLIVRTKQPLNRFNGIKVFFHDNSVVLLDKKKNPISSRIFGSVPYELREKRFLKLLLMANSVI